MTDNKPEGPICASHTRKRWNVDKTIFDWHRWCPFEERPWLRWVIPIGLAAVVIAAMIIGIVVTTEYYTTYYASGVWLLGKEKNETASPAAHEVSSLSSIKEPFGICGDQQHGCGKYGQPVSSRLHCTLALHYCLKLFYEGRRLTYGRTEHLLRRRPGMLHDRFQRIWHLRT
jgi:hypothetical protein